MPFRRDEKDLLPLVASLKLRTTMRSWLDLLRLETSQSPARGDEVDDAADVPLFMEYLSPKRERGSHDPWTNVAREDFEDIRFIARGSFGKVSLVRHKATQRMLALKEMAGVPGDAEKIKMLGLKEADIMKSIRHPYIVRLQHVFLSDSSVCLAMEFVPGEDLWSLMYEKKQAPISEARAMMYLAQIVLALDYLHEKGIVYCDLKSENVIVDIHGKIRLVDFGCAQRLQAGAICTAKCGTIQCLAPEAISVYYEDGGYSFPADYWALGVLAYEMIVGRAPFKFEPSKETPKKFAKRISTESADLFVPSSVSESAGDLLRGLLNPDPCLRLGKQVRECNFFAGVDFHTLIRKNVSTPKRVPSDSALSSKI